MKSENDAVRAMMNLAAWNEYLSVQGGFGKSGTSRRITERGFGGSEAEKKCVLKTAFQIHYR